MTKLLIIAAFLVLVDPRVGFNDAYMPKFLFNFSKDDTWWLDFDLLPTFIGAIMLIIVAVMLERREPRLDARNARMQGIVLSVLSVATFAQFSGQLIAQLNRDAESSVFNPGFVSDILYCVTDLVCYILAALMLAHLVDLLSYEVSLNENTQKKALMERAVPFAMYFRTFCAFPVFIRIFMIIMNFDSAALMSNIAAVAYHAICIFSAVMFALFAKKIENARTAK